MKMLKVFLAAFLFLITAILPIKSSFAALPFVTDDAEIANVNQLVVETFVERWTLPAKQSADVGAARLYGPYLSFSYGVNKYLEFSFANMASYNVISHRRAFMNPILQLKTKIYEGQKNSLIPAAAIDWGYVNKNGQGEYYDPATNYYAIATLTHKLFDELLIIHTNIGKKASYNIAAIDGNVMRTHLGLALDFELLRKDLRLVVESYNGAPNSPRDSPSYFRSKQVGLRYIYNDHRMFYVIYGTQPTFIDYDANLQKQYRQTSWVQVGARLTFDDFF